MTRQMIAGGVFQAHSGLFDIAMDLVASAARALAAAEAAFGAAVDSREAQARLIHAIENLG